MFQESRLDSGLFFVEHGEDEARVSRALREYDADLRLVPQDSDTHGRRIYKVYRYAGSDRPAEFLLYWANERGEPYPLSMRLLDEIKRHDKNTRGDKFDADAEYQRVVNAGRKNFDDESQQLAEEYARREGRVSAFHRSPALAAARRRGRRKGTTYD